MNIEDRVTILCVIETLRAFSLMEGVLFTERMSEGLMRAAQRLNELVEHNGGIDKNDEKEPAPEEKEPAPEEKEEEDADWLTVDELIEQGCIESRSGIRNKLVDAFVRRRKKTVFGAKGSVSYAYEYSTKDILEKMKMGLIRLKFRKD